MHILQLVPRLDVGGVERGVLDLARGAVRRGHRVSVVSAGGELVPRLLEAGAMHYTMPVDQKSPWTVWQQIPRLITLIRATGVDLVHARSRVPAWSGWAAARRAAVPFVTTCHGFYRHHPASYSMTWGRRVIVPSQALGRYLIDAFGVSPERLHVIPRGVALDEFPFRGAPRHTGEAWRIGIIGRVTALKGHRIALQALHQLRQRGVAARLCIIGDDPAQKSQLQQSLRQLAESLDVDGAVDWLGVRHDVAACLRDLDVVVAPALYPESFGRSLMEAQAVGVPVVASHLGAYPEILEHEVTGLLVEPGDPSELATAIQRFMDDEGLRARVSTRARQRVEERFAVDRMVEETLAVYDACLTKPRVLIWKLGALGDVVLASPSLRAIRRRFPDSSIHLVVNRAFYEVVARCPYVNEIVVMDPARKDRTLAGKWRFVRRLRHLGADVSIDLQNSRLTHGLAWLAGIPMRVGYARRWGRLLTHPVVVPREPMDPIRHQQRVLHATGVIPDGEALELWPSARDEEHVEALLQEARFDPQKPIVGLHPGGSDRWVTKRWDLERWAQLCDRLASQDVQLVMTGTAAEQPLGERIASLSQARPFLAMGRTDVPELAALIRRCRVFVTHDSAPLHLAAAMGTPTIALFGPTDPRRHVPPTPLVHAIAKRVWCGPCYARRCRTLTHACMKKITVEEVARAVDEWLAQPRVPGHRVADVAPAHPHVS